MNRKEFSFGISLFRISWNTYFFDYEFSILSFPSIQGRGFIAVYSDNYDGAELFILWVRVYKTCKFIDHPF